MPSKNVAGRNQNKGVKHRRECHIHHLYEEIRYCSKRAAIANRFLQNILVNLSTKNYRSRNHDAKVSAKNGNALSFCALNFCLGNHIFMGSDLERRCG